MPRLAAWRRNGFYQPRLFNSRNLDVKSGRRGRSHSAGQLAFQKVAASDPPDPLIQSLSTHEVTDTAVRIGDDQVDATPTELFLER
jgi:hypothetical protein